MAQVVAGAGEPSNGEARGGASPVIDRDGPMRLRAIFDQHYDFVWRSARRLGVAAEAVDDAAQEIFLVASRKLDQIRPGSERAFLFSTALRVASDSRRATARRHEVADGEDESVLELAPDPSPGPDELTDQKRARELLDAVIRSLPIDLRSVFVLFELEGMSMIEIAACIDIPAGTVASRLRRGREMFHEKVKRLQARGGLR
jgi:RNA polymerase sigma-70 factor, ECF subfamily